MFNKETEKCYFPIYFIEKGKIIHGNVLSEDEFVYTISMWDDLLIRTISKNRCSYNFKEIMVDLLK